MFSVYQMPEVVSGFIPGGRNHRGVILAHQLKIHSPHDLVVHKHSYHSCVPFNRTIHLGRVQQHVNWYKRRLSRTHSRSVSCWRRHHVPSTWWVCMSDGGWGRVCVTLSGPRVDGVLWYRVRLCRECRLVLQQETLLSTDGGACAEITIFNKIINNYFVQRCTFKSFYRQICFKVSIKPNLTNYGDFSFKQYQSIWRKYLSVRRPELFYNVFCFIEEKVRGS